MLRPWLVGFLIGPLLTADTAGDHDAVTFFQVVSNHFTAFTPDFYINGIVDVVAFFVFTLADATVKSAAA